MSHEVHLVSLPFAIKNGCLKLQKSWLRRYALKPRSPLVVFRRLKRKRVVRFWGLWTRGSVGHYRADRAKGLRGGCVVSYGACLFRSCRYQRADYGRLMQIFSVISLPFFSPFFIPLLFHPSFAPCKLS